MNGTRQPDRPPPRWPRAAIGIGIGAFLVTSGVVSWATPDGNLVVTLVPALAVGLAAFGLVAWRVRRRRS